jgi:hypothetical protein
MDVINPYGEKILRRFILDMKKRVFSIMTQLLQNSWAFSSENLGNNMFFKIYIGEAHMGYTQGRCRHFEVEPIHLAFTFNQFKSKNGSAFSKWTKF